MKIIFFILTLCFTGQAYAACSAPSGAASQTRYDTTTNKMYYCNNTNWVEMSGGGSSGGSGDGNIFCERVEYNKTWPNGSNLVTFTAAECGGTLPNSQYFGAVSSLEFCGTGINERVQQPSNGESPGVRFWMGGSCNSAESRVAATFIHSNSGIMGPPGPPGPSGGATPSFESTELPYTNNTRISVNHGLGRTPAHYAVVVRNKVANLGYSPGDEIHITNMMDGDGSRGWVTWANDTKINLFFDNIPLQNTNADYDGSTNANSWRVVFYAW